MKRKEPDVFEIELRNFKINGEAKYTLSPLEADILERLIKMDGESISAKKIAKLIKSKPDSIQTQISEIRRKYPLIKEHVRTDVGYGYFWK